MRKTEIFELWFASLLYIDFFGFINLNYSRVTKEFNIDFGSFGKRPIGGNKNNVSRKWWLHPIEVSAISSVMIVGSIGLFPYGIKIAHGHNFRIQKFRYIIGDYDTGLKGKILGRKMGTYN